MNDEILNEEVGNSYPIDEEHLLITEIFKVGLKTCSPKVLLSLMPPDEDHCLHTEHIKSHLQKYRKNSSRSVDDFTNFYNTELKPKFREWDRAEGWTSELKLDLEKIPPTALEVFDTHRKPPSAIGDCNSRELRSSKFSSNPEILSVLNEHRALFSEFVKSTDNFVELGFNLRKDLSRVHLAQSSRRSLKRMQIDENNQTSGRILKPKIK